MRIHIHRGQNQIGGSIIEISTDNTRVIFDAGINLDEPKDIEVPQIEGLFTGDPYYDAVIISHYHSDHMGLLSFVLEEIPIYIGKQAYKIYEAASSYMNKEIQFAHLEYESENPLVIGEFTITPYRCDHSAYDSYMFLITDGKKKILYTGDFRTNGRLKNYEELLSHFSDIDALIVEGTMLSRETFNNNIEEEDLEDIAVNVMKEYKGPAFLMASAMNVDRMITGYNAAIKSGRLFLEDLYTAGILSAVGEGVPCSGTRDVQVFMTGGDHQYRMLKKYESCKTWKDKIAKSQFLMCIRPTMRNYLESLNKDCSFENGILFYGMWKGYQERPDMKEFLSYMGSLGVKIHILHTSGHADIEAIDKLVNKTRPKMIIPVHTENPEWYKKYDIPLITEKFIEI